MFVFHCRAAIIAKLGRAAARTALRRDVQKLAAPHTRTAGGFTPVAAAATARCASSSTRSMSSAPRETGVSGHTDEQKKRAETRRGVRALPPQKKDVPKSASFRFLFLPPSLHSFFQKINTHRRPFRAQSVNRLLYRAKQRGFLELDIIMGEWAERHLPSQGDAFLASFSDVLDEENPELFKWWGLYKLQCS
jgi:succinate dehydrogenase flavin-adding protein (antitoxin of CptAB toxin-antitoxin module)